MIKILLGLSTLAILSFNACTTDSIGDAKYKASVARANEDYMLALRHCEQFSGDARSLCRTEAKVGKTKTIAASKAGNLGTAAALTQADYDEANADLKLEEERCNTYGGDAKTACLAKARAAHAETTAAIKSKVGEEEADWKVVTAQCAELAGTYRSTCMAEARAKFGR
ncbi:MAG: hypothetical protein ABIP64_11025 [Burkholderiales bacterium]